MKENLRSSKQDVVKAREQLVLDALTELLKGGVAVTARQVCDWINQQSDKHTHVSSISYILQRLYFKHEVTCRFEYHLDCNTYGLPGMIRTNQT